MRLLLPAFENLARDIARLVGLGPVELWLDLGFVPSRGKTAADAAPFKDVGAHTLGFIRLDRARMGFFLGNSNGGESVKYLLAFDFELSR